MTSANDKTGAASLDLRPAALFFVLLLLGRILGLISVYFFEEDEVSLALGAAALVNDTAGSLYRYTVQIGYYRLVEGLDLILGSRIDWIPWIMKVLSAISGALIPTVGFFAFKSELTLLERWLVAFTLALNPIVWRSSQYGNAAIVSTALSTVGLVMLSNRPRLLAQAGALTLIGLGILVRADAILLLPVAFFLLRWAEDSTAHALKLSVGFGLAMAVLYGVLFVVDPRMDSALRSVSKHMLSTPNPTMFWEFLLWAMSPIPVILAIWGFRSLLASRARLAALLVICSAPTLLFYFRATTTCRYFLNVALPFSIAAAVAIPELVTLATAWMERRLAWAIVICVASVHLFLALGHVSPTRPAELFYGGTFTTHDGPMPTGALLVRSYLTPGSFLRSLPRPAFGTQSVPFWEGVAFRKAIKTLSDPGQAPKTAVVLLGGGFPHAFHFHAHEAGATYESGPTAELLWGDDIWMRLGNAHVMTVPAEGPAYEALKRFDVKSGDVIWALGTKPFPDEAALAKLPPGLSLAATPTFDSHVRTFEVVERTVAER